MDLKFAEYLLALHDARSVTRAAQGLNMSQGALSNFLMKQEEAMGMQIFIRHKNTLIPTATGRLYLNALRQMVSLKEYAYQSIRTQCGTKGEVIRIGVTPSRGLQCLTDAYSEYVKHYPAVKLDIHEEYVSRLKDMITEQKIDMFFGAVTKEEIETSCWTSCKSRRIPVVAAVHKFLAPGLGETPVKGRFAAVRCSDLKELPMIIHGERTSIRRLQDQLVMAERFSPAVIAEGNNSSMVKSLIQKGLGVGFIPEHYMDEEDMASVKAFYIEPRLSIYRCIAVPKNKEMTEAQSCLADLMWAQELRGSGGADSSEE